MIAEKHVTHHCAISYSMRLCPPRTNLDTEPRQLLQQSSPSWFDPSRPQTWKKSDSQRTRMEEGFVAAEA